MTRCRLPILAAALAVAAGGEVRAQACGQPCVGPEHGAIIAASGGRLGLNIYAEFVKLSGGPDAKIVLIPTAGARYGSHDGWTAIEELRRAGVKQLEVLHTRSSSVADLDALAAPLREATGVWFSGGRQFRLVEVYLGTRVHDELEGVDTRNGDFVTLGIDVGKTQR
ncbi:MAG: Type 1 glutamine amidotransferase-like domain-containing protein [Gemmatimonadetes bacterium]|jgi:cyanophycinase|nr:Type 1 glutamine amidotransferase-like domain-containing protein [Gemmatimonadota bacterium]